MTQEQQVTPLPAAVYDEWKALIDGVFAQLNDGQVPSVDQRQRFERLVRWGLHVPYPLAGSVPVDSARGTTLANRLQQVGNLFKGRLPHGASGKTAEPQPAADPQRLEKERQARNPDSPPELLAGLAKDQDTGVRLALASNPKLAPDLLLELRYDPDRMVRAAAAAHPYMPPQALAEMADSSDKLVLLRLAQNPQTPPKTLALLADTDEVKIQMAVVFNPGTPSKVVEHVKSITTDESVRSHARVVLQKRTTE